MKAMLLAAGLGTRLRPLTNIKPKPAIEFLNIPLLNYSVALLQSSENFKVEQFVVNTSHLPDQIQNLTKKWPYNAQLSHEPGDPLGSGGGIWKAKEFLKNEDDFFVTNGDEVIFPNQSNMIQKMYMQHKKENAIATFLVKKDSRVGTQFGGLWADNQKRIFSVGKTNPFDDNSLFHEFKKEITSSSQLQAYHYVGVMLLSKNVWPYFPEGESNILHDVVMKAARDGQKVQIFFDDCRWFETGNIHDFLEATQIILKDFEKNPNDVYLQYLFKKNAELMGGILSTMKGKNLIGSDSIINGSLENYNVIGHNCMIPKNSQLNSVVIGSDVQLTENVYTNEIILK